MATVRKAQSRRRITVPIEWAMKAAAIRKAPTISSTQPTRIAVVTEATAGSRIAKHPIRIATTPIPTSGFQLLPSPSRTSGAIDAPPISIEQPYAAVRTGSMAEKGHGTLRADPGWCSRLARLVLVQEARVQVLPPELGAGGGRRPRRGPLVSSPGR